jgi:hypothetical protein
MKYRFNVLKWNTAFPKLAVIAIAIIPVMYACKKGNTPSDGLFNAAAAKEWYYGTFKKSPAWLGSALRGKKLPDWNNGIFRQVGNTEVVEFPLISKRKAFPLTSANAAGEVDIAKTAAGSLSRILFISKPNNQVIIREVDYVPDAQYLKTHQFDISESSLIQVNSDFTGRIIVKDWSGKKLARWYVENGSVTKRGHVTVPLINSDARITEECVTYEICEYEQICTEYWQGDEFIGEQCDPWTPTGNCWYEEYCEGTTCGSGVSDEECLCQTFLMCDDGGGGGGEDPQDCNLPSPGEVLAGGSTASEDVLETMGSEYTDAGIQKRAWNDKWVFYKGHWAWYNWQYLSYEEGVHYKEAGTWKWESITHKYETTEGSTPFDITFTMNNVATTISPNKSTAEIKLDYLVKVCISCLDIPLGCDNKNESSGHSWPCKQ